MQCYCALLPDKRFIDVTHDPNLAMPSAADVIPARLAVIGCGNRSRSDEGVGSFVVARLRQCALPEDVTLHDAGADGLATLYHARGARSIIVVDSRAPSGTPGAIHAVVGHRHQKHLPSRPAQQEFRWYDALREGRDIHGRDFPPAQVILIEAKSTTYGLTLSATVKDAAHRVVARITTIAHSSETPPSTMFH